MSSSPSSRSIDSPSLKKRKGENFLQPDTSDSDSDAQAQPEIADGPVLSHADRRRKRKAGKHQVKEEDSSAKKRKLDNGKSTPTPSSEKSKHSVWVGNMSFKTTRENLKTFFKDIGDVMRIHMPTKAATKPGIKPENRGFAYVDFATEEEKAAAIALSENPLVGRKLLIKDGNDFAGRPAVGGAEHIATGSVTHSKTAQKILRAQKQPPAPTLFLGNLGFETTEQDIRQLFEAHKPKNTNTKSKPEGDEKDATREDVWLRKIRMGTFEDSGLCKGFAFIDFTSIEHATASLVNPKNHHLNGRKLVVEYAGADAVRRGAPKSKSRQNVAHTSLNIKSNIRDDSAHPKKPPKDQTEVLESASSSPLHTDKKREGKHQHPNSNDGDNTKISRGHGKEKEPKTGERRDKGPRSRPKPGAALALAKRESAAILPNRAQKIVF